jgi:hypothetical protein
MRVKQPVIGSRVFMPEPNKTPADAKLSIPHPPEARGHNQRMIQSDERSAQALTDGNRPWRLSYAAGRVSERPARLQRQINLCDFRRF